MEEQASLLPGVATAHDLMHRVVALQQRINQLTTQFATKTLFSMQSGASLSRSRLSRARH